MRRNTHGHRLPMTPEYALKEFGHKLTPFEKNEILEYPEVWFLGMEARKTEGVPGAAQNAGTNCEYCCFTPQAGLMLSVRIPYREILMPQYYQSHMYNTSVCCFLHTYMFLLLI